MCLLPLKTGTKLWCMRVLSSTPFSFKYCPGKKGFLFSLCQMWECVIMLKWCRVCHLKTGTGDLPSFLNFDICRFSHEHFSVQNNAQEKMFFLYLLYPKPRMPIVQLLPWLDMSTCLFMYNPSCIVQLKLPISSHLVSPMGLCCSHLRIGD